jgi:hypothetical protein
MSYLKAHAIALSRIADMQAHVAMMQAANQDRLANGYSVAYTEDHFANLASDYKADEDSILALFSEAKS